MRAVTISKEVHLLTGMSDVVTCRIDIYLGVSMGPYVTPQLTDVSYNLIY